MALSFNIIFEDEHLLVVDKPSGILSIGDRFTFNTPSILSKLRKSRETVMTVHRLDKETSGLLVFAKTPETHRELSIMFENRDVTKKYKAFVEGITPESGIIEEPIAESPNQPGKMVVYKKGKPSTTLFTTIAHFGNISLVDIELITGRTHQIRVHFSHIGYPLFIDPLYHSRSEFFLSEIKGRKFRIGKNKEEKPLIYRLTLHSYQLQFDHPITKEAMIFESELPKDMRALENQLNKLTNK